MGGFQDPWHDERVKNFVSNQTWYWIAGEEVDAAEAEQFRQEQQETFQQQQLAKQQQGLAMRQERR